MAKISRPVFVLLGLMGVTIAFAGDTLVDCLRDGGEMSYLRSHATYSLSGAYNGSGDYDSTNPFVATFQELGSGTGLDFTIPINQLVDVIYDNNCCPGQSQTPITFLATILGPDTVEWNFSGVLNICVDIEIEGIRVPFLITNASARIRLQISQIACQVDPHNKLTHPVSLRLDPVGGNEGNIINAEMYLFCSGQQGDRVDASIYDQVAAGYGGKWLEKSDGEVAGDCCINDADLSQVLLDFGTNNDRSDTNGDGIVDDTDLSTVLRNFGMCACP